MMRFFLSAGVAALSLTLLAAPQTRADGRQGNGPSHKGPARSDHRPAPSHVDHKGMRHWSHNFKASSRFGYSKHGFRSLYYSHYRWSDDYRCYLYWAPSYRCWFFYEPTVAYYVPVSYYREVYPETAPAVATVTPPAPVVQQTTVVVTPPTPIAPVAPVADAAPPGPIPPLAPAPTAVQKTKVGPGVP